MRCRGVMIINTKRDVFHSLEYSRLETPKSKAKFLEIVLFKNPIIRFLDAWHRFWLVEVDNTTFICFQCSHGKVKSLPWQCLPL